MQKALNICHKALQCSETKIHGQHTVAGKYLCKFYSKKKKSDDEDCTKRSAYDNCESQITEKLNTKIKAEIRNSCPVFYTGKVKKKTICEERREDKCKEEREMKKCDAAIQQKDCKNLGPDCRSPKHAKNKDIPARQCKEKANIPGCPKPVKDEDK